MPVPENQRRVKRTVLKGETPNPIDLPTGCRFHPRCPIAIPRCSQVEPKLEDLDDNHQAACLLIEQD